MAEGWSKCLVLWMAGRERQQTTLCRCTQEIPRKVEHNPYLLLYLPKLQFISYAVALTFLKYCIHSVTH